jgi:hypothetical protein
MKNFHSRKKIKNSIKYFIEKKSSLSQRITKENKNKNKIDPPPFSNDPIAHHQKINSLIFF